MNPSPDLRHQRFLHSLVRLLDGACMPGFRAVGECAWKPGPDEFAPDVMVCERNEEAIRFTGVPMRASSSLRSRHGGRPLERAHELTVTGRPFHSTVRPVRAW